jgi:hypothetical protein
MPSIAVAVSAPKFSVLCLLCFHLTKCIASHLLQVFCHTACVSISCPLTVKSVFVCAGESVPVSVPQVSGYPSCGFNSNTLNELCRSYGKGISLHHRERSADIPLFALGNTASITLQQDGLAVLFIIRFILGGHCCLGMCTRSWGHGHAIAERF